jgi:hypothetical protein
MNTLSIYRRKIFRKCIVKSNTHKPFYRKHLEEYLGDRFNLETYNNVLDEVIKDVEQRLKALTN